MPIPYFSSGPCRKYHTFDSTSYPNALLHRSRQANDCKEVLIRTIQLTKEALNLPDGYEIMITQGSDTGAIETAFWNLLTQNGTTVLSWSNFGKKWKNDLSQQLKLENLESHQLDYQNMTYQDLVDLGKEIPSQNDLVFVWNATTVGVCVPDLEWLPRSHQGLVIVDGTSIVFAKDLPWERLDTVSFSWQKVLGGEAGIGMLVLSPKALQRLETYTPQWPVPNLLNLKDSRGRFNQSLITNNTTNTISFLLIDDYLQALEWWNNAYGTSQNAYNYLQEKLNWIDNWLTTIKDPKKLEYLIKDPKLRSPTGVTFLTDLTEDQLEQMHHYFETQMIALDIKSHPSTGKGVRIWVGPTVSFDDLKILFKNLSNYLFPPKKN